MTMLPSRGLRPVLTHARLQLRSSVIRQKKFSTSPSISSPVPRWRSPQSFSRIYAQTRPSLACSSVTASLHAPRFYSSEAPLDPSTTASANTAATGAPTSIPYDSALPQYEELKNLDFAFGANEQNMGYLKDLGLDFGWGPTSVMQYLLEVCHTGMNGLMPMPSWWVAIAMVAVIVRVGITPLYKSTVNQAARMRALVPVTAPLREEMQAASNAGEMARYRQLAAQLSDVYKRSGALPSPASFLPVFIQGVCGYGMWKLLRNMAQLPVPSMLDGGFGWISNLAVADPYFILPIATSLIMHVSAKRGNDSGQPPPEGWQRNLMLYWLPGLSAVITSFLPAGAQLYFAINTILMRVQGELLRFNGFRRMLGVEPLYDLPPPPASSSSSSPKPSDSTAGSMRYQKPNRTIDTKLTTTKLGKTAAPVQKDEPEAKKWYKPWTYDNFQSSRASSAAADGEDAEERYRARARAYETQRQADVKARKEEARAERERRLRG
ncbi:hypothetical protein EJ05DRAFT_513722 [Pseudovirgaria hyperparasitica]|uniref:Membrane insertase YidC/Oxa/ALB C-terminal domain-containing protein n=1 Tax=Pseudovirgaria hyperparasitica TaxID=470096 RepID=A0A6A6VYP9_9PEZI|nr:uncharacterized protein EJ05DRAFT_513722 [Pseudovirgaria hyperparasitica]KAF2754800.1 hypothetical protein EJ05DRAFT_513722 [Pseudovirgaria hyperparasitica]